MSPRCGSEIAWLESFDDATKAAKESKKPVLWFVPKTQSSRMDRNQELYWYMMGGAFSDPSFVSYINEHFVALRLGFLPAFRSQRPSWLPRDRRQRRQLAERYNLKNLEFIEPGFLILNSEMETVQAMDRLTTYNSAWMMNRLEKLAATYPQLGLPKSIPARDLGSLKKAHGELAAGRPNTALPLFEKEAKNKTLGKEARYFVGVCQQLMGMTSAGDATWKALASQAEGDRWGWKAQIELERWGPFMRGFENHYDYPERALNADRLTDSDLPSDEAHKPEMLKRALDIVLRMQRENGGWDDSWYDFGGLDSLPNVHVAVSALCCLALLEWREVDRSRVEAALRRAHSYLLDEGNTNPLDQDEQAFAHAYRLLYLVRLKHAEPEWAKGLEAKTQEVVKLVEKLQEDSGIWHHEYPNPFVSALCLFVLNEAAEAGVKVNRGQLKSGAKALDLSRATDGTFSYGFNRRGRARPSSIQGAAGRMPLCELGLFVTGNSSMERLGTALKASFEHRKYLEAVRKYDNHADRYANGGFFFWFDQHMRAEALQRYKGEEREAWIGEVRKLIFNIHEADGGWIDSHELGKSYGTAMGLITLKLTESIGD